eukprot:CAMPEP_0202389176 /NCGR_PEP_ID=MMETSP1127-20130417/81429_1 /ASSEMBLY_ACC=CAM_ASM_000462 /TAXON_ID=3047 /ORGANISM="Dunaliella tertiolecta, Strain CCMP1320" /LENGTH=235 /DNA_ID=CAMNT_0048990835 /DNA_START=68 /DNA_END=775 /DNA_ORIENTATION=+
MKEDEGPSTSRPVQEATNPEDSHKVPCYLILFSVAKRHNVGTITRCATAFGVKQVCLVGSNQFNTFGAHGSDAHVDFRHFPTLEECVQQLKNKEGCEIIGIEITDDAQPVHSHPFQGPTAFMLGNEGHGMTPRQMALCDKFVYISQYGAGTASLNVAVATSIVLHHFALWAGYSEHSREGAKFIVNERPTRTRPRNAVGLDPEVVRAMRQAQGEGAEEAAATEASAGEMLSELLG